MFRDKVKLHFCFRTIYRNLQAEFELSEITFYKRARPVRSGKYISNTVRIYTKKIINKLLRVRNSTMKTVNYTNGHNVYLQYVII
jgi:hypothetical protein